PHNQICTDCSDRQSSYVDLDYGVFICDLCASLHTTCNHTKQSYNP
ncbi:rho guanine nucleotide exchange factor, putative, partial [Entamoeba histolytica KU27]